MKSLLHWLVVVGCMPMQLVHLCMPFPFLTAGRPCSAAATGHQRPCGQAGRGSERWQPSRVQLLLGRRCAVLVALHRLPAAGATAMLQVGQGHNCSPAGGTRLMPCGMCPLANVLLSRLPSTPHSWLRGAPLCAGATALCRRSTPYLPPLPPRSSSGSRRGRCRAPPRGAAWSTPRSWGRRFRCCRAPSSTAWVSAL